MNHNMIFLTEHDWDKPIYRIFSFARLEEIFQESKITLVKPKLWDDPFENFILNATGVMPDGRQIEIGMRNNFYGQCWSLTKESDAMWRIYSHDKDGVKVKTTIRKLFLPLFQFGGQYQRSPNGELYNLSSFIGKVRYSSTKTLTEMLKDTERMTGKIYDQSGRGQASTFFFKRMAFKHEREIRLIYNSLGSNEHNLFKFDVDPNELIDEIVFDPRMEALTYESLKSQVRGWGYRGGIIQSGLYKIKAFEMPLNYP